MAKIFNRALQVAGEPRAYSSIGLTITEYDGSGLVMKCKGTTKPTDGLAGFGVGAIWTDSDSGIGSTFYINEGSATSCDFNEVGAGAQGPTGPTGATGSTPTETTDHGTASTDQLVNVCYGTGATGPTASDTTEGTLYITYTP